MCEQKKNIRNVKGGAQAAKFEVARRLNLKWRGGENQGGEAAKKCANRKKIFEVRRAGIMLLQA